MRQRLPLSTSTSRRLQGFQRLLPSMSYIPHLIIRDHHISFSINSNKQNTMQIEIHRTQTNRLYTEGHIIVNGANFSHTIEHTSTMLPTGKYKVVLKKISSSHRAIAIIPQSNKEDAHLSTIEQGASWITANKIALKQSLTTSPILIGSPLIPGVIKHSANSYNRLFERLKKCKTEVTLTIRDTQCKPNAPSSHWVKRETRNSKL